MCRRGKKKELVHIFQRNTHVQRVENESSQQPNLQWVSKEVRVNVLQGWRQDRERARPARGTCAARKPPCVWAPCLPNSPQPPAPPDPGNNAALCWRVSSLSCWDCAFCDGLGEEEWRSWSGRLGLWITHVTWLGRLQQLPRATQGHTVNVAWAHAWRLVSQLPGALLWTTEPGKGQRMGWRWGRTVQRGPLSSLSWCHEAGLDVFFLIPESVSDVPESHRISGSSLKPAGPWLIPWFRQALTPSAHRLSPRTGICVEDGETTLFWSIQWVGRSWGWLCFPEPSKS